MDNSEKKMMELIPDYKTRFLLGGNDTTTVCKDVNMIIKEELTVNDKLVTLARACRDHIRRQFNDSRWWHVSSESETVNGRGVTYKKGYKSVTFTAPLWGKELSLNVSMFDYPDTMSKKHYLDTDRERNHINDDMTTIELTVKAVRGRTDWGVVYRNIMHELTHGMQYIHGTPKTGKELYDTATKWFSSDDETERAVGKIVYYSDRDETEAFGNSLYAELEDRHNMDPYGKTDFKSTKTHGILETIKQCVEYVKSHREEVEDLINDQLQGLITYNKLLMKGEKLYSAFLWKCGHVLMKFQKDNNNVLRY